MLSRAFLYSKYRIPNAIGIRTTMRYSTEKLAEKFFNKNVHPKGTEFSNVQRQRVVKAIENQRGQPAPLYSDIPGQRPFELLMGHIIENAPQTKQELWDSISPKGFLNSKTHLNKLLQNLKLRAWVSTFPSKDNSSFRYRFNTGKANLWIRHLKSVYNERSRFIRAFQKHQTKLNATSVPSPVISPDDGVPTFEAVVMGDDVEIVDTREVAAPRRKMSNAADDYERGGSARGRNQRGGDGDGGEAEEQAGDKVEDEDGKGGVASDEMDEEWFCLLRDGVGYTKTVPVGSTHMARKIMREKLLGKTGPLPRRRKTALEFIKKKQREFKEARAMFRLKNID